MNTKSLLEFKKFYPLSKLNELYLHTVGRQVDDLIIKFDVVSVRTTDTRNASRQLLSK